MPNPGGGGHLLELTIISAQDLHPATRSMRTYAAAYVSVDHKLYTRLDPTAGGAHPTWNDKFVFRLDDAFLRSDTSAVTVDIRAARRCLPDRRIGTARVVLSAVLRPCSFNKTRFVALQVRRPSSLRPQGILNLGVAILDPGVRSVPLFYSTPSTVAFAYKDLVVGGLDDSLRVSPVLAQSPSAVGGEDRAKLERCGSVEVGGWAVEREMKALESKLEKWRTELPPQHGQGRDHCTDGGAAAGGRISCFCGGRVSEQ